MVFGPHCHDFTVVFRLDMCSECFFLFSSHVPLTRLTKKITYLLTYLVGTQTPQLPKASSSQVRSSSRITPGYTLGLLRHHSATSDVSASGLGTDDH